MPTQTWTYTCTCMYMCVCVCVCVCIYTYSVWGVCMHICVDGVVCECVCVCRENKQRQRNENKSVGPPNITCSYKNPLIIIAQGERERGERERERERERELSAQTGFYPKCCVNWAGCCPYNAKTHTPPTYIIATYASKKEPTCITAGNHTMLILFTIAFSSSIMMPSASLDQF